MANMTGWTGKILKVNLSTGAISTIDTAKYTDFIGGEGMALKIIFDEVPVGTQPYDAANELVFAVGPITGAGALCSGRTTVTGLTAMNPFGAVADSHFGGYWGSELKYAGWDALVVVGKAESPVWIRIDDDKVRIESARQLWGKGCFETQAMVATVMGKEAQVACIGPAGENLMASSTIRTGNDHHGGGHGAIMGSKNLKAIGIRGTGAVHIAATGAEWNKIVRENFAVIGSNNNHVVPNSPQPWAEFTNKSTRWTASKGRFWGAATPPVETGTCDPHDINSVGFRCFKSIFDLGPLAEKYTVRMGGCASCPIRCHSQLYIPAMENYGYSPYVASTCMGFSEGSTIMFKGAKDVVEKGDGMMMAKALGAQIENDLGLWPNYGLFLQDWVYAYSSGKVKQYVPEEEYKQIRFDLFEDKDIAFLKDFFTRIATKTGEFSHLGDGSAAIAKRWHFGDDYYNSAKYVCWNKTMGFPRHHSSESDGQVGALINLMKNRDAGNHSHQNVLFCGLPVDILKQVAKEIWGGEDAVDAPLNYTPINEHKINFAKWSMVKYALHDSLTLCNWVWPMTVSPLKERNYRGNLDLEAEYYSAATGKKKTQAELDFDAERVLQLHRAMCMLEMNTKDMRHEHDLIPEWVFDDGKGTKPFTKGTTILDRDDMEKARDMFYEAFGWDKSTGAPTKATLHKFGLDDVAAALDKKGLLVG